MKSYINIALTTVLLCTMVQPLAMAADFDKDAALKDAKNITKGFAGSLQKELQSAMKAGGPLNALQVCNIEAMPITAQSSTDSDALVSRVSLKNRNPNNAPNEWQRAILEDFDKRVAAGEDPQPMASATVVKLDNGKHQFRFMKAVPTGGVCLVCHGQSIDLSLIHI